MEEKNAIQKIIDDAITKMQLYARQQRIAIMKLYSWDTKKPYSLDSKSWRETMEKITTESILSGVSEGIIGVYAIADIQKVSKYFLDFSVDGVTLSGRLRDSAKLAEKLVFDTMNQHIKNKTNFLSLTKDFTANKISRGDLPKYLTELADAAKSVGGNTIKINRLINDANKQISGLKTGGYSQVNLDRAYKKVVDAVKSGDVTTINNALKVAIDQKAVSNNSRIASTETVRANTKATLRKAVDNPLYKKGRVCAKVTLSPDHPIPDVCDYHAQVDSFGLGPGVSPIDKAILPDYHPRCACSWSVIIVDENVSGINRIAGSDDKFYKKVSPEKAKLIKKSNGYLKDWKTGKVEPLPAELVKPIKKLDIGSKFDEIKGSIKKWSRSDFVDMVDNASEKVRQVISKTKPINGLSNATKKSGSFYRPSSQEITSSKDATTFIHEYGHHVDNVNNLLTKGSVFGNNYSHARYLDAQGKTTQSCIDDIKSMDKSKPYVRAISDIYDAMTTGKMYENYLPGHGKKYYSRYDKDWKGKEIFANMFSIHGSEGFEILSSRFPNMTKVFLEWLDNESK